MASATFNTNNQYSGTMTVLERSVHQGLVKEDALKFTKDFLAGASAAVVAKTVIAPVERVKLILQLQSAQTTLAPEKRYKGVIDCFVRVPKEQGFFSFWRGNWVNILRACSQVCIGIDREFKGMFDCIAKIVRHDGIFGLYKGLLPSLQYILMYRGAYYGLFDSAKPFLAKDGQNLGFWRAFAAGQVVTFIAAMSSYPLDTVRRRLMMSAGKKEFLYHGTMDCAKYIYMKEGWRAFFNGAMVNAMRGTGAALVLALYNEMAKYM
uniref:ADP/ATP translocase n=1 Tax=Heterorhabditis bacteriophora TaxID=37862 RepID=A0A1I7XG80_HETBA